EYGILKYDEFPRSNGELAARKMSGPRTPGADSSHRARSKRRRCARGVVQGSHLGREHGRTIPFSDIARYRRMASGGPIKLPVALLVLYLQSFRHADTSPAN